MMCLGSSLCLIDSFVIDGTWDCVHRHHSCRLDLHCFRIALLSLETMESFVFWPQWRGLSCCMMKQVNAFLLGAQRGNCVGELSYKLSGTWARFLAKSDEAFQLTEVLLHSDFELLLCVSCEHVPCFVAFDSAGWCCSSNKHQFHCLVGSCRVRMWSAWKCTGSESTGCGHPCKISLRLANLS